MPRNEHTPFELNEAWVKQAQADADEGVIECRVCKQRVGLDEAMTLWRNGVLVFAVCDRCSGSHDLCIGPTERGIKVEVRRKGPLIIGGS